MKNLNIFFSIFNLNPAIAIMKTPKHLLNAKDVATFMTGAETHTSKC